MAWATATARVANDREAAFADSLASRQVGVVEDLLARFREQQASFLFITPPISDFTLTQPCGIMPFDWKSFPDEFNKGLIGEMVGDCPLYTITILEDPENHEIVFANADGKEIYTLKPEAGYDPYWQLNQQYPNLLMGGYSQVEIDRLRKDYDSARVRITFTLLPSEYVRVYAEARAAQMATSTSLNSGGVGMMRYSGPPVTNLLFTSIEPQTNGVLLTLVYPNDFTNRVDVFTCTNLLDFWWDLAVTTNVNTSTNWIEWLDSSPPAVRFYVAGNADTNADTDADGDGLTAARETYLYHTSTTTNDTDHDGLTDYEEVINRHTDPNNGDTNRPTVWITFPTNMMERTWLP
jgi:hypothetical protein